MAGDIIQANVGVKGAASGESQGSPLYVYEKSRDSGSGTMYGDIV